MGAFKNYHLFFYFVFSNERCLLEHFGGSKDPKWMCFLKALSDHHDQTTERLSSWILSLNHLSGCPTTLWGNTCKTDFNSNKGNFVQKRELNVKKKRKRKICWKLPLKFRNPFFLKVYASEKRHRKVGPLVQRLKAKGPDPTRDVRVCGGGPAPALIWPYVGPSQSLQPFIQCWFQVSKWILRTGSLHLKQKFL